MRNNVAFKIAGWVKFSRVDTGLLRRECIQIPLEPPMSGLVSAGGALPCKETFTVVTLHATGKTLNNLALYEFIS